MESFLDRLRAQPEPVRRHIAFFATFLIGIAALVFWFSSLPDRFETQETVAEERGPFTLLGQQIAGAWSEFLNVFSDGTDTSRDGVVNLEDYGSSR